MNPPGRNRDSRIRHPSKGSARWCSTPIAPMMSNVRSMAPSSRMSACAYSMFVRPSSRVFTHGIADAAQTQVDREHTNSAESLVNEDRIAARAAPGDKHLRCTVVRHWRNWRERQRATQFGIELLRLSTHLHFYPARKGILFILVANRF